jgi:hypothetical protein
MDAVLGLSMAVDITAGAIDCVNAGVAVAAANVTETRKTR